MKIRPRHAPLLALCLLASQPACKSQVHVLGPKLQAGQRNSTFQQTARVFSVPSNGLTMLLIPDRNTNLVKVDVRYPVGAMEDPRDRQGLAHLVEHLTFSARPGGARTPSVRDQLGDVTLSYNAFTTLEETQYTSVASADKLPDVLAAEAARMRSQCEHISDDELARVREVVRNEIREQASVSKAVVAAVRQATFGADHPYNTSVGGDDAALAAISRDDVCALMQAYYQPASTVVAVSGDIDLQGTTKLIARLFGRIPRREEKARVTIEPVDLRGTTSEHQLPVTRAQAAIALRAPRRLERDAVTARITHRLLEQRLRSLEQSNPTITNIFSGRLMHTGAPVTYIHVTVDRPENLKSAVDEVFIQTSRVANAMDWQDFDRLRTTEAAILLTSMESFQMQSNLVMEYVQAGDDQQFLAREIQLLTRMEMAEVTSYVDRYFTRQRSHVAYFYPAPDATATERRAALHYDRSSDNVYRWEQAHDPAEAEKPVPVAATTLTTKIEELSLPNGMKVYLAPDLSYPVMDIRVIFPVGRAHDPADKIGLAATAAELVRPSVQVFTGTEIQDIRTVLRMGGEFRYLLDDASTSFRMRGMSMFADGLVWHLYFLLTSSEYDADTLEQTQQKVAAVGSARPRWPDVVMKALHGEIYPTGIGGKDQRDIARISVADLKRFRDTFYHPEGAAIVVTGQFDAQLVKSEVTRLFGTWKGRAGPAPRTMPALVARDRPVHVASFDDKAIQTRLVVAFGTGDDGLAGRAAQLVLEELVRDKLQVLRRTLGATYGVEVTSLQFRGSGLLAIESSVDRERAGETHVAMQRAIDELRAGDFVDSFIRARRQVVQELMASTINSYTVASRLERAAMTGEDAASQAAVLQQVAALRPQAIRTLIARDLAPGRQVTVVHGQKQSVEAVYQAAGVSDVQTAR